MGPKHTVFNRRCGPISRRQFAGHRSSQRVPSRPRSCRHRQWLSRVLLPSTATLERWKAENNHCSSGWHSSDTNQHRQNLNLCRARRGGRYIELLIFRWMGVDRSNPAATVSVDIFDGATLIATLSANGYRPDLQSAGIGNGRHAYYYATPQTLKDGRPHVISVRVNQTNVNLSGTGRTIACAAQ